MNKIRAYISSFRLRTLPLSLSGIILGIMIAANETIINFFSVTLLINTTICLQILSNLANEYGDMSKGTDNNKRLGPIRSIQNGSLSQKNILNAIFVFIILSIMNGIFLLIVSLDSIFSPSGIMFLILGAAAIAAAILYTVGKHAYGYRGLGDIFVFIFFGLISTIGAYTLSGGINPLPIILPASAIGLLSCAVLNINNIRDIENDELCGKRTLAVRLGIKKARLYHLAIISCAIVAQTLYHIFFNSGFPYFSIVIPVLFVHTLFMFKHNGKILDKQMPIMALSTLVFAVLAAI